jgi:hypothetical protein
MRFRHPLQGQGPLALYLGLAGCGARPRVI